MKNVFIYIFISIQLLPARKIQTLKKLNGLSNPLIHKINERKVFPFNEATKTKVIYIFDSKSNKLEFINYNKHGLNYSQTIYNLSKNTKKMISFTDCLQEDCF